MRLRLRLRSLYEAKMASVRIIPGRCFSLPARRYDRSHMDGVYGPTPGNLSDSTGSPYGRTPTATLPRWQLSCDRRT